PRRTRSAQSGCAPDSLRLACAGNDGDRVTLEHSHLREPLDAVILPVAHVDKAVVAADHAVRMAAVARAERRREIRYRIVDGTRNAAPLPKPRTGGAKNDYAVVPVAVGDVDAATLVSHGIRIRIDPDGGGLVKQRVAHVRQRVAARVTAGVSGRRNGRY